MVSEDSDKQPLKTWKALEPFYPVLSFVVKSDNLNYLYFQRDNVCTWSVCDFAGRCKCSGVAP